MARNMTCADSKRALFFAPTVLLLLASIGCQWLKKTDNGADAQASAAVSATAAPAASSAPVIATVAQVPSVATAATATHGQVAISKSKVTTASGTAAGTATKTAAGTSTATNTSGATTAGSTSAATSTATAVTPAVNAQCLTACQKSYQTCTSEAGTLTGVDLVRKCRAALVPCLSACK